tara:strand:+ start:33 stop:227 length:195 start_codon:yes stop_codon:yes gene_type:complete
MDSFLYNHQSALDNQREDDAIKDLQDSGVYPDPDDDEISVDDDDYEPTDFEMLSYFGTKWHDYL